MSRFPRQEEALLPCKPLFSSFLPFATGEGGLCPGLF